MTPYGKKLLLAKDATEFKRLLEISSEGIWDTGQTRWQGTAIVTDDTTAHGGKVLYLEGTNLQTAAPVTFGGDPFTINFSFRRSGSLASNTTYNIFRALGQTRSFGLQIKTTGTASIVFLQVSRGTTSLTTNGLELVNNYTSKGWQTFEFDYDGAGKLTCKFNGSASKYSGTDGNPISLTIAREPRRLFFGAFPGYVDDFELVDNGVVKSALNFERVTL